MTRVIENWNSLVPGIPEQQCKEPYEFVSVNLDGTMAIEDIRTPENEGWRTTLISMGLYK